MYIVTENKCAERLIAILKEYRACSGITSDEFIQDKVKNGLCNNHTKNIYENFKMITKMEEFFENIVDVFFTYYKIKRDKELVTVLMYILIFGLEESNYEITLHTFVKYQYKYNVDIFPFFTDDEHLIDITQAGIKVFDYDFILTNVVHAILNKKYLIDNLYKDFQASRIEQGNVTVKPLTKPVAPSCFNRVRKTPTVPANTPKNEAKFKARQIPKSVLAGGERAEAKYSAWHAENRKRAEELLKLAQEKAFSCAKVKLHTEPTNNLPLFSFTPGPATKIPQYRNVDIKENTTSVLREASIAAKKQNAEKEKLQALTQGVFNPDAIKELEKNICRAREIQKYQEIEKNHLKGLLTFEEAILAKKKVLESNMRKMIKFKEERKQIVEEAQKWRAAEEDRLKFLLESVRKSDASGKEAERRIAEKKKHDARIFSQQLKETLNEAYDRSREELACKARLIQELRSLHKLRIIPSKEFDKTETPNFGLLCEMSIAELQERLALLRAELQEELSKRKKAISDTKVKKQLLLEVTKKFLGENKCVKIKPKSKSKEKLKIEDTPDISALRDKLEHARFLRCTTSNTNSKMSKR